MENQEPHERPERARHFELDIPVDGESPRTLDNTKRLKPVIISAIAVTIIVSTGIFSINYFTTREAKITKAPEAPQSITLSKHFDQFAALPLKARAVYVYDMRNKKILFAKNEEEQLPLASLTKVMLAATAAGSIPDSTVVTVPKVQVKNSQELASATGLRPGDRVKFRDLLDYTLSVSSNEGASLIASLGSATETNSVGTTSTFVDAMNANAKKLGMKGKFFNESGLDMSKTQAGAYGSAHDMAILFEYMLNYHRDLLEATTLEDVTIDTLDNQKRTAKNTNILVESTPRILASKTGQTPLAGGNLVMAVDADIDHPIIIAVLGSTETGRFDDVRALINKTREVLNLED